MREESPQLLSDLEDTETDKEIEAGIIYAGPSTSRRIASTKKLRRTCEFFSVLNALMPMLIIHLLQLVLLLKSQ